MVRAVLVAVLVALTGCDRLFGLTHVPGVDGGDDSGSKSDAGHDVCLSEDFDGITSLPVVWGVTTNGVAIDLTNDTLRMRLAEDTDALSYGTVYAKVPYDFRGAAMSLKAVQTPNTATSAEMELAINIDEMGDYKMIATAGFVGVYGDENGVDVIVKDARFHPVKPNDYWRIRHDLGDGSLVYEVGDPVGGWNRIGHHVPQADLSAVTVYFNAGTYQPVIAPGSAVFDDFLLEGPNCN